jgi:2,3-dihydroxyphenylpropionate 1,2-dioxygenase
MIVGSVCMSHSPLKDRTRPDLEIEARFSSALLSVANFVEDQQPDITIIFYPDHVNGFFYGLLPSFCIGIEGESVGDYGTAAGKLCIAGDRASDLARSVLDAGVDVAISHNMQIDHGAVQPLELLSASHPLKRIIPIFVNCAAPPLPTFARARALGRAVGDWARQAPERILIIGSGGLSHDPPMAELASATPEVRERLIFGSALDHAQRFARQNRAMAEGNAMAAGQSRLLPPNAEWDRKLMDAFLAETLTVLDECTQDDISSVAGRGGHETRTWVAALAALGSGYTAQEIYCEIIDEWITGMGILSAVPKQS